MVSALLLDVLALGLLHLNTYLANVEGLTNSVDSVDGQKRRHQPLINGV